MRENILVVGSADMDLLMPVKSMPAAGTGSTESGKCRYSAGGSGALSAMAITALGGSACFVARVGNDIHGKRLLNLYEENGLDSRYVAIDPRAATGLRVVIQEANGNRRTIHYPGANANLQRADVERAMQGAGANAAYLQLGLPAEILLSVARAASAGGVPLFLDAAGVRPDTPLHSLGAVEAFIADSAEVEQLTGIPTIGSTSGLKAVIELGKHVRAKYYLIKMGERGIFYYDGVYHNLEVGGARHPDGVPLCPSLAAAVFLEYLRNGRDMRAACRFGMALDALIVKNGSRPSYFPTAEEVRAVADRR